MQNGPRASVQTLCPASTCAPRLAAGESQSSTHPVVSITPMTPTGAARPQAFACAQRQKLPQPSPGNTRMEATRFEAMDVGRLREIVRRWGTSPYFSGAAATVVFYLAIPHLPASRELAERYFRAHPVEYVQTALFFGGLCLLIWRMAGLRAERAAVRACTLACGARDLADA